MAPRVLVLGGYGAFGARAVERLAGDSTIELIVAGRSAGKATTFCNDIEARFGQRPRAEALDVTTIEPPDLARLGPAVVINASGPYQAQDYRVAEAAIACGAHYLDLSDAGAFATGITALDDKARNAGVLVASGASSVPSLSAAVVDHVAPQFSQLTSITTVIAPGNSFDPGLATTRSILGRVGRPIPAFRDGTRTIAYGWQGLMRHRMPGLGARWIGDCDAPDLAIFPARYPGLQAVRVCAALEVGAFHLGLWALSGLVRARLLREPERLAAPLIALKSRLPALGSDRGGMTVEILGAGPDGRPRRVLWSLVARNGHGPFIPAMASVILTRKLIDGRLSQRGAMPAVGLFSLQEFRDAVSDLAITDEALIS